MKAKKIYIVQIIIFIILFVIIESSSRIFITRREFNGLAMREMINKLNLFIYTSNYKKNNGIIQRQKCINKKILEELNINKENNLIKSLKKKYEYGFSNFIKTASNNSKPKILLVYLPLIENNTFQNKFSEYFKKLSVDNKVEFINLTGALVNSGGIENWSLLPKNSHYSRYGNKIIADEIKPISEELLPKSQFDKKNIHNKKIKAGLNRNKNLLWNNAPSMVYRVKTNSNGFRNSEDISDNLIVGVYGGSYTFGPYLPNHDTFPSILESKIRNNNQERFQRLQVLNAGLAGTNIFHQIQVLEQTQSINLDLIIIQVSDRDIYAVSSAYMKVIGPIKINDDSLFLPSPVEKEVYKSCGIEFNK